MKLSSKARYGLKTMLILAEHYSENEPLSVSFLSKQVHVTEKYLEQIINLLKKANLVQACRGSQGGYFLSKHPGYITIGEILRVLEDDLKFVDCLNDKCKNDERCQSYSIWKKLYSEINSFLDSISLESMLKKEEEK